MGGWPRAIAFKDASVLFRENEAGKYGGEAAGRVEAIRPNGYRISESEVRRVKGCQCATIGVSNVLRPDIDF